MARKAEVDQISTPSVGKLAGALEAHPRVVAAGDEGGGEVQRLLAQRREGFDARLTCGFGRGDQQGGAGGQLRPSREHAGDQNRAQAVADQHRAGVAQDGASQFSLPACRVGAGRVRQVNHQRLGIGCGPPMLPMRGG